MADKVYVRRYGTGANDTLNGDGNNDLMYGFAGNDTLSGNGGDDRLLGGDGDDTLYGGIGNDDLFGDKGNDRLFGGDGLDTLNGGEGRDHMDGGNGVDTVDYQLSSARVTVNLALGLGRDGDAQGDTYASIENVLGSAFNDSIIGNDDKNRVEGNDGDDFIDGRGGDDYLSGGLGNDTFMGGEGADQMHGQLGNDWVDYSNAPPVTASVFGGVEGMWISLQSNSGAGGYAEGDTYSNIENVRGSNGVDNILGNASANIIEGGGGNDVIIGFGGTDTLDGGEGVDVLSYYFSTSAVTVNLGTNTANGGDATGNTIRNFESVYGSNSGGDSLTGSSGDNLLNGYGGNDTINGGQGNDTMIGGEGSDTFVFDLAYFADGVSHDRITDFRVGIDRIEIRGVGVDSMSDLTISQQWGFTMVSFEDNFGNVDTIALNGVVASQLNSESFLFS